MKHGRCLPTVHPYLLLCLKQCLRRHDGRDMESKIKMLLGVRAYEAAFTESFSPESSSPESSGFPKDWETLHKTAVP